MKRVHMLRTAAPSILLLAVFGCATALPPPPVDPAVAMNSGIVVVSVEMHLPKRFLRFGARAADSVFMYRIAGNAAPYTPGPLVWSDLVIDGHAVFLEVPPGRYVVAGAVVELTSSSGTGPVSVGGGVSLGVSVTTVTSLTAYFSDELVRSLFVEVGVGSVAILGEVEVDLASIRALDEAQRYAYRRIAPDHESGRSSWLSSEKHYRATVRHVDQSQARIDEISRDVSGKLLKAGWPWQEPSGPSTIAALDYLPSESLYPIDSEEGSPLVGVSLQVVDGVNSETSAEDLTSFEALLAFELAEAGFAVVEGSAELAIRVEVSELTSGSRLFSFKDESAVLDYVVTVSHPSGEILGRSGGEQRLGDAIFTLEDPKNMGAATTMELLFARAAGDIVDYTQVLHRIPAEAIARWLNRPVIQIVWKDRVGTDDSAAASAALEERLAEELGELGHRLGGGDEALTLEVKIVKYTPGNRAMRLVFGFGAGAARLDYEATLLDASGNLLGHREEGCASYELGKTLEIQAYKSDSEVRLNMLDQCVRQLSEYVQSLPIAGANQVSAGP